MKLLFATAFLLLFYCMDLCAQMKPESIVGTWKTSGEKSAKVQIYKTSKNTFEGKIVWLEHPMENGTERLDKNNPDKNLQKRKVLGLAILKDFRFNGSEEWENGSIYDPKSGKTYSCVISMKDANTLKVRGYVGISLLGRTELWSRVL